MATKKKDGEAPAAVPTPRKLTSYVVLKLYEGPIGAHGDPAGDFEVWEPMRSEDAKNASDACRQAAKALAEGGAELAPGRWRAVPLSSWNGDGGIYIENEQRIVSKVTPLTGGRSTPIEGGGKA